MATLCHIMDSSSEGAMATLCHIMDSVGVSSNEPWQHCVS